jgi:hypothetical protein
MFFRDEVVAMMTEYINERNRKVMVEMNANDSQIESRLAQMQSELIFVNGELYDMLKENGVIP